MKLKHYEMICVVIAAFLGYEFLIFNNQIQSVSLIKLINTTFFSKYVLNLDPTPGHPLSYFLGWLGFLIMCTTNPYIIRKRFDFLKGIGKLTGWLEFHIFCGMLGPILIVFHSNFKVQGLVSISFWSMVICSSSGIIGRYFYVQTLKKKDELRKNIQAIKDGFIKKHSGRFTPEKFDEIFIFANKQAGVIESDVNPFIIFILSLKHDIVLSFSNLGKPFGLSLYDGKTLKQYGVENRRLILLDPFNKLLGYWHSFHLPFAFFMYIVAIIHIIAALMFGVKH
jgi:hypothetical protein